MAKPFVGSDKAVSKCPGSAVNVTSLFNTAGLSVHWNVSRPDSVVSPGKYTLVVTNNRGCKDTALATVIDYAKPKIGNDTTVYTCPGSTRSIRNVYNLSQFTVQQWSVANPDSVGAGTYTLIAETAIITVAEKAAPVPVINPGGTVGICNGDSVLLIVTGGEFIAYAWSNNKTTASIWVKAAGTYSVRVTDSAGCTGNSAPVNVQMNPSPAAPVITSSPDVTTNMCPGASVTLTSSTAARYLWSTGDSTKSINTDAAGSYLVTIYDGNGCSAKSAPKVVSYLCPAPSDLAATNVTASSATLSWRNASCFAGYQMQYRVKGATSAKGVSTTDSLAAISGLTASTTYEWRVRTVCSNSPLTTGNFTGYAEFTTPSSLVARSSGTDVMKAEEAKWQAMVYPNPAKQKAILQVIGLNEYTVTVTSAQGKVLWQSGRNSTDNISLPVGSFASGVYLVSIAGKNETKTVRLIVER